MDEQPPEADEKVWKCPQCGAFDYRRIRGSKDENWGHYQCSKCYTGGLGEWELKLESVEEK